jgi:hypothetical protein
VVVSGTSRRVTYPRALHFSFVTALHFSRGGHRAEGGRVNNKRALRLRQREGLKVPKKVRKKRRLGHDGNGCNQRRAYRPNEVWSYDFIFDQTADGR